MEVDFTPDQQALVSDAIASGRLHRPEEAMQQALLLWEERERRRLEILAAVELSKASLARGEGRTGHDPRGIRPARERHHPARYGAACLRAKLAQMNL